VSVNTILRDFFSFGSRNETRSIIEDSIGPVERFIIPDGVSLVFFWKLGKTFEETHHGSFTTMFRRSFESLSYQTGFLVSEGSTRFYTSTVVSVNTILRDFFHLEVETKQDLLLKTQLVFRSSVSSFPMVSQLTHKCDPVF